MRGPVERNAKNFSSGPGFAIQASYSVSSVSVASIVVFFSTAIPLDFTDPAKSKNRPVCRSVLGIAIHLFSAP